MCMTMYPPERRECIPLSSGENPSLAGPTLDESVWGTEMISKGLKERIIKGVPE